jgi:hypothetical protein
MVTRFDELTSSGPAVWADWLIALVPRSWLLYKSSVQLAELLAERCSELLEMVSDPKTGLDRIREVLDTIWPSLQGAGEEPRRWRRLAGKMKRILRGGKE